MAIQKMKAYTLYNYYPSIMAIQKMKWNPHFLIKHDRIRSHGNTIIKIKPVSIGNTTLSFLTIHNHHSSVKRHAKFWYFLFVHPTTEKCYSFGEQWTYRS